MNQNGGPERLIAQMKSLSGTTDGFHIVSSLTTGQKPLMREFRSFKDFANLTSAKLGLKRSGEFYFNYRLGGFTGIVCFNGSHLSIQTDLVNEKVNFEIFVADRIINNINIAEELYQSSIGFFQASVLSVDHVSR